MLLYASPDPLCTVHICPIDINDAAPCCCCTKIVMGLPYTYFALKLPFAENIQIQQSPELSPLTIEPEISLTSQFLLIVSPKTPLPCPHYIFSFFYLSSPRTSQVHLLISLCTIELGHLRITFCSLCSFCCHLPFCLGIIIQKILYILR